MAWCLRSPEIDAVFEIFKLNVDELRLVETRADEWTYRSRVEANIVETRDDEPRKMDLLFIVVRCLRSPIVDLTHRDRMTECRGSKGRYPRAGREASRSRVEVRRVATPERKCEARRQRVRVRKVVISEWNYETRRLRIEKW